MIKIEDCIFASPEIGYLINDEECFKEILLCCLDELLDYNLDTMFK